MGNSEEKGGARRALAAGVAGLLVGGVGVALASGTIGGGTDQERVEAIVHDYILANPEILPEAMRRLQDRERAGAVEQHRAALETPFHGAWAGAADGDVVLVEFFDYACGFCRTANPDVDRLLREDDRLKVVWRELPVLGEDSQAAAFASLSAAQANRFKAFHEQLFQLGRPTASNVAQASRAVGIEPRRAPEYQAEIERNYELARAIGTSGTPTFVVGGKVLQGAVGYETLKAAVAEARTGTRS
jgi:protein-disulfide isomerase